MITYLKVRNLAIVEEFVIEPGAGLNVLTGETGAGKSLLIDSLEFLSGARGSTEMIRAGADKMSAEAILQVPGGVGEQLNAIGIDIESTDEGIELIVKREIAASGRGRVLVNGSPLAVRELGTAMEAVLEVHGQHESHSRVAGQTFRELLDEYAGHQELLDAARATYHAWKSAADQLKSMQQAQADRALRLDLLRYQVDEISAARLDPGEEDSLRTERALLGHAREIIESTAGAYQVIEEDESAAIAQIARAMHLLQPLTRDIADVRQITDDLQDVLYRLQEAARALSRLTETTRLDPARLDAVEERLVTIERLNKKYGGSVAAVLDHLSRISDEFDQLSDYESNLEKLARSEAGKLEEYRRAADKLCVSRKRAGHKFQSAIQSELQDLAMEGTAVRIAIETAAESDSRCVIDGSGVAFGPEGYDRIDILVAPNRGEEPKPMQRIASGGELSRIQLAIAAALFKSSTRAAAATLVFDEIDAGIGGRVAEVVGRKLQELALKNQVICVTHLPQIASFGTTHFYVWKEDAGKHTRARIRKLDDREERVSEIARMLGGESIAASAVLHARELLDTAAAKPVRRR